MLNGEICVRPRRPEPQGVDSFAAVPHHRPIERHTDEAGWAADDGSQGSTAHLEGAVEFYVHGLVWTLDLPRVWTPKPIVRQFMLQSIKNGWQHELPDNWLRRPDPWGVQRPYETGDIKINCAFEVPG